MNRADELAFQAIIEEFSALRAEVLARVKTRDQLMLVALGASGALLSFAFSAAANQIGSRQGLALYVVAPITSAMGGLWISNNWNMYNIHFYIIEVLAPRANDILQNGSHAKVLGWESSAQRGSKARFVSWMERTFFMISFILPGVTAQLLLLESSGSFATGFRQLRFSAIYAVNWLLILAVVLGVFVSFLMRRKREPAKGPLVN